MSLKLFKKDYKNRRCFRICCLSLSIFLLTGLRYANAEISDLTLALQNTRNACSGISDAMYDLKTKAGINTAVTGVGTEEIDITRDEDQSLVGSYPDTIGMVLLHALNEFRRDDITVLIRSCSS